MEFQSSTTVQADFQPILQPGCVYDFGGELGTVEYVGTSGKKSNEVKGFRFWSLRRGEMVSVAADTFDAVRRGEDYSL